MILSDNDLQYCIEKKKLIINPIKDNTIRENGLDLTIGNEIGIEIATISRLDDEDIIDTHNKHDVENKFRKEIAKIDHENKEYFIIQPKTLYLLTTNEYVKFPDDLAGLCAIRSTIARHGFISPITIVDAGFEGNLTIEVFYAGIKPLKLYVNDRFLHVIVCKLYSPTRNVYNGVYKGQIGVKFPKCID